jgi:hypothetical protein
MSVAVRAYWAEDGGDVNNDDIIRGSWQVSVH